MDERNIMHGIMVGSNSGTEGDQAVTPAQAEEETGLRRGPWTVEEDLVLVNYIAVHGEGRWNSLARAAGLKRSGKSCRLRWLNYLRPGVRRGNFTPEEQLVILDLHSRWGNRWSKIAQHLPGRTDNEIKNYWRTRVQKHAKQLKCDVTSQQFKDAVRYLWMPRLIERIQAASESAATASASAAAHATSTSTVVPTTASTVADTYVLPATTVEPIQPTAATVAQVMSLQPDHSNMGVMSPDSPGVTWLSSPPPVSNLTDCYIVQGAEEFPTGPMASRAGGCSESLLSPCGYYFDEGVLAMEQSGWEVAGGFSSENLWLADDITWFLQQKL